MQPIGDHSAPYSNYNLPPHLQSSNSFPNPNPNPNFNELFSQTHASAPPFSNYQSSPAPASNYAPPTYSSPYTPYTQNPDAAPSIAPSVPSFSQTPSFHQPYPHLQSQPPSVPYYPYDHQVTDVSYQPSLSSVPTNQNPNLNHNLNPHPDLSPPSFSASYPTSYVSPMHENPYDGGLNFEKGASTGGGGYIDGNSAVRSGLGVSASDFQSAIYDKAASQFNRGSGLEDGVYAYDGGKLEPYGARGTGSFKSPSPSFSRSSPWSQFDDYGRSISSSEQQIGSSKIVKAVPKIETQQDANNGVQKFRVKILPEGEGQSNMDVLCQIGLDGVRMLDPSTSRTLRVYPLETITRWEVVDPSVYTFWAKSLVDVEPRRIRLQSNRYTTSTLLDTVAAASVQLKEMSENRIKGSPDSVKPVEQITERKKGLADWVHFMKPGNEEKDHWVPDEAVSKCTACGADFGAFVRKHHCRNCGDIFCDKCTQGRIALTADEQAQPVRVCDRCLAEVSQRLSFAKESRAKSDIQQSHEDLARKLQDELERNRKGSSGSNSTDGFDRRMKDVACPICTVHLQVRIPTSGSETIECGVCQHPFLVSAH